MTKSIEPTVKRIVVYACPECGSEYETAKGAKSCMKQHAEAAIAAALRNEMLGELTAIRDSAKTFKELSEGVTKWGQKYYVPEFQFDATKYRFNVTGSKISAAYIDIVVTYKAKNVHRTEASRALGKRIPFYRDWGVRASEFEIATDDLMRMLGIRGGCGSGQENGLFAWQAQIDSFDTLPMIGEELERAIRLAANTRAIVNRMVDETEANVNAIPEIAQHSNSIAGLEEQISVLRAQVREHECQQAVIAQDHYERASNLIKEVQLAVMSDPGYVQLLKGISEHLPLSMTKITYDGNWNYTRR